MKRTLGYNPTMASPLPLQYATPPASPPLRPIAAIGIGATAALAGTLVGITTIWGQEFGGLLAVIVGLIIFWFRWRRHRSQMTASNG